MVIKDYEIPGLGEGPELGERWTLIFDGASIAIGHGIEVVLMSPKKFYFPFTTKLSFDRTNKIVEYGACILGL